MRVRPLTVTNRTCQRVEDAVRAAVEGKPMATEQYEFPTVYDGLRGMQFIQRAVESCEKGSAWVEL